MTTSDLLRLATVGSVDDGKSTLIGRLLVDTRQLFDDQLHAVAEASERRGVGDLDLSFVTDGLRAEREQGITIDVAYRYASTPTRKFIIADCPGHVQYTRNMATGASTADLALVVLNVAHGVKEQTRRHLTIAALLGVRQAVVAINKMDLVNWSREAYTSVADEVETLCRDLGYRRVQTIPISALEGDNVAERRSDCWYDGPSVLQALEAVPGRDEASTSARLPIQWVLRQPGGGRTYAGLLNGSRLRVGDEVTLWPAGVTTRIRGISTPGGSRSEVDPGLSIDLDLADETDAGRGDLIALDPAPTVTKEFRATVCWFADGPLVSGARLRLKHTTKSTRARVSALEGVMDLDHITLSPADRLVTNDIGVVQIQCADFLCVDDYRDNRMTGSFVLIDEVSHATVAAGMIGEGAFGPRPDL
ncbi:MAG: sulfate adenylyltransferase [Acidimicrobiaceae bacterium]|nr:sulfate adenylyltransferase [Acidimicrobiaceae bacterium]